MAVAKKRGTARTRSKRGEKSAEAEAIAPAPRSAIKRGEPNALRLLGYGDKARVEIEQIRFTPKRVAIGGKVTLSFTLRSTSKKPQDLLVDIAVHFVKATRPRGLGIMGASLCRASDC